MFYNTKPNVPKTRDFNLLLIYSLFLYLCFLPLCPIPYFTFFVSLFSFSFFLYFFLFSYSSHFRLFLIFPFARLPFTLSQFSATFSLCHVLFITVAVYLSFLSSVYPLRLTYFTFLVSRVRLRIGVPWIVKVLALDAFHSLYPVVFPYTAVWPLSSSQKRMSLAKFLS
jgi:hypothetical protein